MKKLLNLLLAACVALAAACTPAVEEDSISVSTFEVTTPSAASTIIVGVTANRTDWKATTDAEWCLVKKGANQITINVEENTSDERTAIIFLTCGSASANVIITQENGIVIIEDEISVSTLKVTTPSSASTVIVGVNASSDDWSAKSNTDWCGVEVGDNTITITTAENTSVERTATVTLTCGTATSSIEVTQEDGTIIIEDEISVADIELNMPANAGSLRLNVTATGDWSVINMAPWLTAEPDENGVLNLSFKANESSERSTTITLVCGTAETKIKIIQAEGYKIGVNPTSLSFAPEGGTLEIGVSANMTWKASTKDTKWLTVTTKNDIVTVKAKANDTEDERKGKVSITYTNAATNAPVSIDVEVVQSAYKVVFTTEDIVLNSDQTTATVKFNASNEWTASVGFAGGPWLEQIATPWATISSTSGAAGEQTLTVNFVGNDYKDRSVSVLVKCGTLSKALTITQKAVPAPQVGRKVRFMTLNQKIRGSKAIAKMITDLDIDYVAVQEIDMFTDRNNFNQLDSLKKYTGYAGYFCKTIDFGGGEYGIGIMSKKEALNTRFVNLTGPESRKLLIAEYDDFVIASTHYTITSSESSMCQYHLESAKITVEELSKYPDKPIVLGGDFNTETDKDRAGTFGEIMKMMDLLTDPKVCTYPNTNSDLLIDFLFFKRDERFPFRKTAGGVLDQNETDHRPVWVELELFF